MFRDALAGRHKVERSGFRWRGGEISRLEQFSDAVFAFALALLVVSTDLPASVADLTGVLRGFPAFGLTFTVLVWIWYLHYQYFRRYGLTDALTITLNGGLLFLVLFYVYPLRFLFGALTDGFLYGAWIFSPAEGGRVLGIYSLGFVSVVGMFALLHGHALARAAALGLDARERAITRAAMQAHLWMVGIGLLVTAIAFLAPGRWSPAGGPVYFLIGPLLWWHWWRAEKRWQAQDEDGSD